MKRYKSTANEYRPTEPFNTALLLYIPIYSEKKGVTVKKYPESGELFYASFKTFGGTETTSNGTYAVVDTAEVVCWFNPNIKSDCKIVIAGTGEEFEIITEPENINRRNQFLSFKIRRIKGGA